MLSFFEYYLFFGALFCIEQLQCVVEMFLACFFAVLFLDTSDDFAKSMAFAWWPFLDIFKMPLFFQYKLFLGAVFCIEQQQSFAEMCFLFFDPK